MIFNKHTGKESRCIYCPQRERIPEPQSAIYGHYGCNLNNNPEYAEKRQDECEKANKRLREQTLSNLNDLFPPPKKQTNFERITASAESLIELMYEIYEGYFSMCDCCTLFGKCEGLREGKCQDGIKQWLDQEVEGEGA